jgi:hypothetical protein
MFSIDIQGTIALDSWWHLLSPNRLDYFWKGIIQSGVRQMGSPAVERALSWIEDGLQGLPTKVERMTFPFQGWRPTEAVSLSLVAPEVRPLAAEAFLYSTSTPPEGLHGRLAPEPSANQRIWEMYSWERWRIIPLDDREGTFTLGYLCARPDGPAIPQLLPYGSAHVPYLIIGEPDSSKIRRWQTEGIEIRMEARLRAESNPNSRGENLSAYWRPRNQPQSDPERHRELVLCAHYDTVYTTSGAYDNASGCALLLELAHLLTGLPEEQTNRLPDLRFVWFGAEELALAGSRSFVSQRKAAGTLSDIQAVINLDGFGRSDVLEIWASPGSASQLAWDCALLACKHCRWDMGVEEPVLEPPRLSLTTPAPPGSDHAPFVEAGIPAIMLTFNDQEILHHYTDSCDSRMLKNMIRGGRVALSLVAALQSQKNQQLLTSTI